MVVIERETLTRGTSTTLGNATTLRLYDFSGAGAKLIASIPGRFGTPEEQRLWGQGAMRHALSSERFHSRFRHGPIVCQYSSTGSTTNKWVEEMRDTFSFGGVAAEERGDIGGGGGGGRGGGGFFAPPPPQLGNGEMQLVWITAEECRTSSIGYAAGGSIPGPAKNINSTKPWIMVRLCAS